MTHIPSDLHCLLTPLSYMEVHEEKEDTECLKSSYSREKVINGYFDLMRKQQASKETGRGLFISAYSNVFTDPPKQLNFSCEIMKKKDLKIRQRDPHTTVISSIIHMEYLITKARKSGIKCDLDDIKEFAKFLNAMDKESRDQEGLTLPVNYVKAVKFAFQFAQENQIKIDKEVNWDDFLEEPIAGESFSDVEYDENREDCENGEPFKEERIAVESSSGSEYDEEDSENVTNDSSKNRTENGNTKVVILNDFEVDNDNSIKIECNSLDISDTEDILIISDDESPTDNEQALNSGFVPSDQLEAEKSQLEVEKSQLEVEKSQLEVEKSQLDVEKSQLDVEKSQLEVEKSKIKPKQVELISPSEEELSYENVVPETEPNNDSDEEPKSKKSKKEKIPIEERGSAPNRKKYNYKLYKKKMTETVVNLINKHCYNFVITDNRCDLFLLLSRENLMLIDEQDLIKLKNSSRSFNTLKVTMEAWGERKTDTKFDSKVDYGSKIISIDKNGEIDLESRKYRKRHKGTVTQTVQYDAYDCSGGKMCSNPQCPFLLRNLKDPLVGNVKNTTQFVVENGDATSCVFCESQGIPNTLVEVMCSNSLYIVQTENGIDIYSLRNHSCQSIFKMDIPKELASDFERHQLGYHEASKSTIRSMILEDTADSAEELYCKSSNFVAGAKFGTTLKHIAMKGKPFKIDLDALISKLRDRDPNFILTYSESIIVVSSTRSLNLMYSENFQEYFLDVCFSRLLASEKLCVVSLYTYDSMVRMVLKLACGYIKSENSQDISKFLITINSAIGKLCSEESYLLRPQHMFVDYADSNKEAFLLAGYQENDVNSMLVGCESHFGDFVDRNIGFFNNGLDRSTFKQLSYDWRNSGTLTLADGRFKVLRDFIFKNSTNRKTVLTALEWWALRPHLTLKMYSSCTVFTSNLAEVGHSPAKKRQIKPEAILQDCVDIVDQNGRRLAFFRGSKYAAGSGPTVLQSKVRYETQVEHKVQEIGRSLEVLDEMECENLQDPGPSGSSNQPNGSDNQPTRSDNQPTQSDNQQTTNTEKGNQAKRKKRTGCSRAFNDNYDRMKRLRVKVKAVVEDNENRKIVSLHVHQTTGLYSRGEDIKITMSQSPSCTCQPCAKQKGKSGKSLNHKLEVCAPQIWIRMRLFKMEVTDENLDIAQVYYSKEELDNIFKKWKSPTILDDRGPEDLRKLFEKKEKSMTQSIIYYIEKIDVNTVHRKKTCRSPIHEQGGLLINQINNLYIRVDNALWVPKDASEAYKSPVYLCATKACARENLPLRCNIYKNRVPDQLKRGEHVHLTDTDITKIYSEGFELD